MHLSSRNIPLFFHYLAFLLLGPALLISCQHNPKQQAGAQTEQAAPSLLRQLYAGPPETWPEPFIDEGVDFEELGTLPEPQHPADNPPTPEKVELGKLLFFDPRLSQSGQIACASCHDPELGWADGRQLAFGHKRRRGKRNAMTVLNSAFYEELFWDGRAESLEHQVLFPIQDQAEMNMDLGRAIARLQASSDYPAMFKAAFGSEGISQARVQKALAAFERTIVSRKSAFDRFVEGDSAALTDLQLRGLHIFRTKARCVNCHHGPLFSDNRFHNLGQSNFGRPSEDLGRYLVTGDTADVGKFRTPSLRDVVFTGPYLHSGNIAELPEILDLYERGMPQILPKNVEGHPLYPKKSDLLHPLPLTKKDKASLLAFLDAISRRPYRVNPPELPN